MIAVDNTYPVGSMTIQPHTSCIRVPQWFILHLLNCIACCVKTEATGENLTLMLCGHMKLWCFKKSQRHFFDIKVTWNAMSWQHVITVPHHSPGSSNPKIASVCICGLCRVARSKTENCVWSRQGGHYLNLICLPHLFLIYMIVNLI